MCRSSGHVYLLVRIVSFRLRSASFFTARTSQQTGNSFACPLKPNLERVVVVKRSIVAPVVQSGKKRGRKGTEDEKEGEEEEEEEEVEEEGRRRFAAAKLAAERPA